MFLFKIKCHLDLPLLCKKVTAKKKEKKQKTGKEGNGVIRLKEKVNEMNKQSLTENLRGRGKYRE